MPRHLGLYKLDDHGIPVPANDEDFSDWSAWLETYRSMNVARDQIGTVLVSTIFFGVDPGAGHHGTPPRLWETMVFDGDRTATYKYLTRTDALIGHRAICDRVHGCVCRTTSCGHLASAHRGPDGACVICQKVCWS